ncbi:MAG: outer membrane protein transport protein [Gemmatimonadota bacterium]|nr:outer membrane protein transport protein [Gemmatimonadota bacterium]MDH3477819.1 outer membrane protein transport protein [Gemmatimonadota bacterium]MDH3569843.1 outer membrane protein transport protein [Gemmatimonadota bacterium]MDH5549931.1 outer membrane protein transport protein [Gemmatimonadota bacterium]
MIWRTGAALAFLTVAIGQPLTAQASVYGVLGVGFPGRAVSVRARALGGGLDALDPRSAVNPAAIAFNGRLTVSGTTETTSRWYEVSGVAAEGLRDTRFPVAMIAGQIQTSPISFGVSYALYAERSFDIQTTDTVTLRGTDVLVTDRVRSDGGITDVRFGLAWALSERVQLGGAFHLLSGSTREQLQRDFDSPDYASVTQRGDVDYSGTGVSVGVMVTPSRRFRFGLAARRDGRLDVSDPLLPVPELQLPWTLTAGWTYAPVRVVRWSASASWRSWGGADVDPSAGLTDQVFDTWEVGTGIEIGGSDVGASRVPLRVGFRYAQLPFSPTADRAREIDFSAGTALSFAANRAIIDAAIERAIRDGGGAVERAWQLSLGLTIRP